LTLISVHDIKRSMTLQPTYRIDLSYEENYRHGPFFRGEIPKREITRRYRLLGFELNSLIGIPAGPLLNSDWIKTYAALGFDLPVYKTVRTRPHPSHPAPNCMFLDLKRQIAEKDFGRRLIALPDGVCERIEEISITNSFGMPSRDPKVWQEDVAEAKRKIGPGQVLIVSVVGTPEQGTDLAEDYAKGALWAKEAGADMVEINLSCPNVISGEGSVFCDPEASARVSSAVKKAIGSTPLLIKIGYIQDPALLARVAAANARHVEGIAGINTLSFEVVKPDGTAALSGEGRLRSGVCGAAIRQCAMAQAARLVEVRRKERYDFIIVGVGGVMTTEDIRAYFALGVDVVMSATGAMWDPYLAYRYWKEEETRSGNR
jgi:dihydroorotate dehydrogenase (NAD+) catalytic subunit